MKIVQAGTASPTGVSTGSVSQQKAATYLRFYLQWYNTTPTWMIYQQRNNFPVPVLAEAQHSNARADGNVGGEAKGESLERESNIKHALRTETSKGLRLPVMDGDSRGGENSL